MKQIYSLFVDAIALVLVGCSVEPLSKEEGDVITIKATIAENNPTKTVIQDSTISVLWEPGDEVKVFYKTTGSRFTSNNTEPAGTADFTGNLTITGFFGEGFTADTPLWAVYPYRADAVSDGESVTTTLPSTQTGRAGSFAKGTNITLAKSSNTTMGFYNVCGGIRFSLTQEGINEVVFEGQNDEDIAGKVKLIFVDGLPSVQEVAEGQKAITLSAPYGQTLETGKWYYIVALPGTLSGGFKMTFNTATQYATLTSSASRTIKRGIFGSIANADEDLVFTDKESGEPNPNDVIQFEDPIAKYACVEKYDTNGDGEVSCAEAASATTLSGLFTDWNTVTSFEEIRFFTSVTSTQNVFSGLTKLTHITIPDNITTLGTFSGCTALETVILPASLNALPTYCFDGCLSLKSVMLPTGITSIPNYSFQNCSALETLSLPSTIKSVGQCAFSGCTVLTGIDLPSGFQTIGNYAFQNCRAIASVDFPATLTSIGQSAFSGCTALMAASIGNGVSVGQYAFSGCSSLASVVLPEDMRILPASCFQNCTALATITWPSALTTVGNTAFYGCSFKDSDYTLQLPASVTSIGSNAFGALRHLILPSASPISISNSFMVGFTVLYVPANMVEMYKVRTNWSNFADRIRPISDYPVTNPVETVDLGLSVKWASSNVGAWGPMDYGDYYAWGETEPYYSNVDPLTWKEGKEDGYSWGTYKWCMGSQTTQTKYCNISYYGNNGFTDSKTLLDLEDDAARANWGATWRMPTDAEWTELRENCTWTWTSQNGVNGRLVTASNGNSIFFPAAGYWNGTDFRNAGSGGVYWSSSLNTDYPDSAWEVEFGSGDCHRRCIPRSYGVPVRPVSE
jgi:hypothetical protein